MTKKRAAVKFIARAREKFKDKYGYDTIEYVNFNTKVTLECPIHKTFQQTPAGHLKSRTGCPKCSMEAMAKNKRHTTNRFIEQARAVHKDKYSYGHTHYKGSLDPVTILCQAHGEFTQIASAHLRGSGCPRCGKERARDAVKMTKEMFLTRAAEIHGKLYCYSKVHTYNYTDTVTITCPNHGDFTQTIGTHLKGSGCPPCGTVRAGASCKVSFADFVRRARATHGDTYRYAEKTYSGIEKKIEIICSSHGKFRQQAGSHIRGRGCRLCANELIAQKRRHTTDEFIELARRKHGDLFDYSKTQYYDLAHDVILVCRKHGEFTCRAGSHLNGTGCPLCTCSAGESRVVHWLSAHDIIFVQEWREHDCVAIEKKASFDFWLPGCQTIIEYDGEPHFMPVSWLCGRKQTPEEAKSTLTKIQLSDANKNAWAAKNSYRMIRIRYDEDVSAVLDAQLLPLL